MFSTLRTRFGIPGVISVIALVFAMFGGAYAASNSSGGGKATASAKAKQGPRGKTGKTGPPGAQGPAGPAGAKGDAGAAGSNGANGAPGAPGTSVKNEAEPKGANCKEGGTKLVGTATTYACNGEKGAPGAPGEPWAVGNELPSEAMETGVWRFVANEDEYQYVPISFPIPLSGQAAEEITVVSLKVEPEPNPNCPGSAAEPKANPGFLCVYAAGFESNFFGNPNFVFKASDTEEEGVSTSGALLYFEGASAGTRRSTGSFAITAP